MFCYGIPIFFVKVSCEPNKPLKYSFRLAVFNYYTRFNSFPILQRCDICFLKENVGSSLGTIAKFGAPIVSVEIKCIEI